MKKHIAQLMVPIVIGGIMPATYAGAEEAKVSEFLVPSTEKATEDKDEIPDGAIPFSSKEELNSILNNSRSKRSSYSYWNDEGWDSSDIVSGIDLAEISVYESKTKNLKVMIKAYKAGTDEYLGEVEGKITGIGTSSISFKAPNTYKGLYASTYFKLDTEYLGRGEAGTITEKDDTYSYSRDVTNSELANGVLYVNMYYYDTIQNGWIQENGKWYYLDMGERSTGWCSGRSTTKRFKNPHPMYVWVGETEWVYLDETGAMITGWREIDGKWYYFYGNGLMARDTTIDGYKLGSNGAWIK